MGVKFGVHTDRTESAEPENANSRINFWAARDESASSSWLTKFRRLPHTRTA
jgi:hypothetical protein